MQTETDAVAPASSIMVSLHTQTNMHGDANRNIRCKAALTGDLCYVGKERQDSQMARGDN